MAIFRMAPRGCICRHAAAVPQIIAVLEGSGEASGNSGDFEPITEGDAVYFSEGEEHEARTTEGMVVLIIEGPAVVPVEGSGR